MYYYYCSRFEGGKNTRLKIIIIIILSDKIAYYFQSPEKHRVKYKISTSIMERNVTVMRRRIYYGLISVCYFILDTN